MPTKRTRVELNANIIQTIAETAGSWAKDFAEKMPRNGANWNRLQELQAQCEAVEERADLYGAAPDLLAALDELCVCAGEANALQHAGLAVPAKVWSAMYQANNRARAALQKAGVRS